jgi:hypothetical protein
VRNFIILIFLFAYSQGFSQYETHEKTTTLVDHPKDVIIHINAPADNLLDPKKKTKLIFFTLPNTNSIEWTAGKKMQPGDDWHYDIQHIAAQTRFLREHLKNFNIIVVYLGTRQQSWPAWKRVYPEYTGIIHGIIDSVYNRFASLKPAIILNSHSGGGSFIFAYLDGISEIPSVIERIAFIDSEYNYEEKYASMFAKWLKTGNKYLSALAYNDSVVIYEGKPLVSPTGGTWYRTKMMQKDLSKYFKFKTQSDTAFINHSALNGRVQFHLKENPGAVIYHTEQVRKNGFIFTNVSGTKDEKRLPFKYWGPWAYSEYILDTKEDVGY